MSSFFHNSPAHPNTFETNTTPSLGSPMSGDPGSPQASTTPSSTSTSLGRHFALRMGHSSTKTSMEAECDHDYFATTDTTTTSFRSPESHFKRAFIHLNQLRKRRQLFDVTLIAHPSNTEIPAHKAVLAACSPYFSAMFTSPLSESTAQTVPIQGVDPEALQQLVEFMYTGEVQVTEDTVQLLLPAANLLQMHEVQDVCCEFLQCQLHPSNCLGIQQFAEMHACAELAVCARQFAEQHFTEVLQFDDEVLQLSERDIDQLLASDRLAVTGEEELLEAVLRWVNHAPHDRAQAGSRLLRRVRYPMLGRDFLIRISSSNASSLAGFSMWGQEFLIEAMRYHLMSQEERLCHQMQMCQVNGTGDCEGDSSFLGLISDATEEDTPSRSSLGANRSASVGTLPCTSSSITSSTLFPSSSGNNSVIGVLDLYRPRVPLATPKCLLVIGGQAPKAIRTVECYDFKTNKWYSLPDMPRRLCRCGVACLNGRLYVIGGFNGVQRQMSCELYEPKDNLWSSVANMNMRRSTLGVVVLRKRIMAVGGFDGITGFASSEWYDPEVDRWEMLPSMHRRRSSVGVAVLEDRWVYSVGGYDGSTRQCLASVERFDVETNTWQFVADMHYARSGCGVAPLLGNRLLVVGGHDGPLVRNSVEVYSPSTDTWTLVANMHLCRRNAGVLTHNGLCYVVGGDDGSANLNSVECYDSKTDKWTLLPATLSTGRSYSGTVIVDRVLL